jgi:hypothetical protein
LLGRHSLARDARIAGVIGAQHTIAIGRAPGL